ncbi:MAG TPA: T9SS type A sorting domain-containing protein [bacterium]|jgi:hypothetical protein
MKRTWIGLLGLVLLVGGVCFGGSPLPQTDFFVQNEGQWEGAFAFKYEGRGAAYFLTESGMTMDLHEDPLLTSPTKWGKDFSRSRDAEADKGLKPLAPAVRGHILRLSYVNANPTPILTGEDKLPSYSNYFLSKDSCKWRSRVGHYRSVTAQDVWPGIDVQYRIAPQGIETVYHVHPGADPTQIQLSYEGQDAPLAVDANGSLLLSTSLGTVKEQTPFAYQNINHTQVEISCRYELTADGSYRFVLGAYDATKEVVIDPELVYSTYWGTGNEMQIGGAGTLVTDSANNPILSGDTFAGDFPTTPGSYENQFAGHFGFISKFAADGRSLIFSTYFPGAIPSLCIDFDQSLVIVDQVVRGWPVTSNGFDTTSNGRSDLALAALSADGSTLLWGSYWGGSGDDYKQDFSLSTDGILWVSTVTESSDFPLTVNALYSQGEGSGGYAVAAFDLRHMNVVFSSFFHAGIRGSGNVWISVTALANRAAWICGIADTMGVLAVTPDALCPRFVPPVGNFFARVRLDDPPTLEYASYFGGQDSLSTGTLHRVIALDSDHVLLEGSVDGSAVGFTMPPGGFQATPRGERDAFLVEVTLPDSMLAGTFIGGAGSETVTCTVVEQRTGSIILWGCTLSDDFPITPNAFQRSHHGMPADYFLSRISPDLSTLRYSTFIGGSDRDWAPCLANVRDLAYVWAGGYTYSSDFPTTPDAIMPPAPGVWPVLVRFDLRDSADVVKPSVIVPPASFSLSAFPNPFNPTTTLSFTLPAPSEVTLEVFDVLGRCVYQKEMGRMNAGEQRYRFEGSELSSGVYFAKVQAGNASQVRKMVLLK